MTQAAFRTEVFLTFGFSLNVIGLVVLKGVMSIAPRLFSSSLSEQVSFSLPLS